MANETQMVASYFCDTIRAHAPRADSKLFHEASCTACLLFSPALGSLTVAALTFCLIERNLFMENALVAAFLDQQDGFLNQLSLDEPDL